MPPLRYDDSVGILYLSALIIGLGTIVVQLFMGGDGDAEVDTEAGAEVGPDMDHDLDADAGQGSHEVDAGFLPIFLSLRFWIFALLAFGMVGSALHYLQLASPLFTLVMAVAMGLGSGTLASWVFRVLNRQAVTSGSSDADAVGHVGKVLIRVGKQGRGKVRIQLKGHTLDLLATTDESDIAEGELVLIEEMRDGQAHVSKAPPDFLPRE